MNVNDAWGVGAVFGLAALVLGMAFLPGDRVGSRFFSLLVGAFMLAGAIAKALYT